jgi:hypothetical protein
VSKHPSWSPAEDAYLEQRAGDVPFSELVRHFQRYAKQQGWPVRSYWAIVKRLRRTGQPARARQGEVITSGGAADILGCPRGRVVSWLARKDIAEILQPRRVGRVRYVERRAWRQLAREMPQVLGGFDVDALYVLLEDRDLAEQLAATHPVTLRDTRIRCVENGAIYSSCHEAARLHHVHPSTINLAIRQRRPVRALGLTFEALRSAADEPTQLRTCSSRS